MPRTLGWPRKSSEQKPNNNDKVVSLALRQSEALDACFMASGSFVNSHEAVRLAA